MSTGIAFPNFSNNLGGPGIGVGRSGEEDTAMEEDRKQTTEDIAMREDREQTAEDTVMGGDWQETAITQRRYILFNALRIKRKSSFWSKQNKDIPCNLQKRNINIPS